MAKCHGRGDLLVPEVSVIVVNWNGKHFLDVCLTALRRQTFSDSETTLVDNASEDSSGVQRE